MKVVDPSGQVWRVSRRWVPWNPHTAGLVKRASSHPWTDVVSFDVVDGVAGFFAVLAITIVLAFLIPVLLAVLLTGVELFFLLLVLPAAIIGRMIFGRRWWVQVRRGWRLETEEMVGDWAASGARVQEIVKQISVTPVS